MEKKLKRKFAKQVAVILALCMLLSSVSPVGIMETRAAGMSLEDLQAKFPDGKYWNHATQSGHDYNESTLVHYGDCNNPNSYTDYPCTNHNLDIRGEGYYDCNTYGGGLQCYGFVNKLSDDVYGSMPLNSHWAETTIGNAKAGDVIHFNTGDAYGHWAMVIGKSGTVVTLGECNYDNHCRISWGRLCDVSNLSYTIYSAPQELQATSTVLPDPVPNSDYDVSVQGDIVTITGYHGSDKDLVIPSMINGKSVDSIGWNAFKGCDNLRSVTIPSSVTSIGGSAFEDCIALTSVIIPSGVTEIESCTFAGCKSLASVTIPNRVTSIGWKAFAGCSELRSVMLPGSVTSIRMSAFSGCSSLKSVSIPDSVTDIGSSAFENCSALTSVMIPSRVTSIEWSTFENCIGLTSVTIPDSVIYIGREAFSGCTGLTSVTIPDSVASIGEDIFSGCTGLSSMTIPGSVKSIGERAFKGCDSLNSVTIQKGVTSIGGAAFYHCDRLRSVTIPDSVTSIGQSAFESCVSLTSVTIPDSVTSIGWYAFSGCIGLTSMTIPGSVTNIEQETFRGCDSLNSVTIQKGVTSIGDYAFWDCGSLRSVMIPESVISIGESAFSGCIGLTSVAIPDSVTSIGDGAFFDCNSLVSVTISDSVTSIGGGAFAYCIGLRSLTIPDSVTSIEGGAFRDCDSLTSVTIPGIVTSIEEWTFASCDSLTSVTIQKGVRSIGENAFRNCDSLTSVTIPDSVTSIGGFAFENCGLISVTIPESVTDIGGNAFGYIYESWEDEDGDTSYGRWKKISGFLIYGESGSGAERYAKKNGFEFRNLSGSAPSQGDASYIDISNASVTLEQNSYVYDGTAKTPSVTVNWEGETLVRDRDYIVLYSDNINPGTAKVTVMGKGSCTGSVTKTFTIRKVDIGIVCKEKAYNVVYGVKPFTIQASTDGTLTYKSSNNKVASVSKSGMVTVKGTGIAYITLKAGTDSLKITVKVSPQKRAVQSLKTEKGKKITVKWKKDKMVSGYEVQLSNSSKFKKIAKKMKVSKNTCTFTNLKMGKKYYVRIRSYKKSGKETLYGAWSNPKKSGAVKK